MQNTLNELPVFLGALYGGLLIGILYDFLRPLRRIIPGRLTDGAVDVLFYAAAGGLAALTLLYLTGGMLRSYALFALVLGALWWQNTVSFCLRSMLGRRFSVQKRAYWKN